MYESFTAFMPQTIAWLVGVGLGSALTWLLMMRHRDWKQFKLMHNATMSRKWESELIRKIAVARMQACDWENRYKELSNRHAPPENPLNDSQTEYDISV